MFIIKSWQLLIENFMLNSKKFKAFTYRKSFLRYPRYTQYMPEFPTTILHHLKWNPYSRIFIFSENLLPQSDIIHHYRFRDTKNYNPLKCAKSPRNEVFLIDFLVLPPITDCLLALYLYLCIIFLNTSNSQLVVQFLTNRTSRKGGYPLFWILDHVKKKWKTQNIPRLQEKDVLYLKVANGNEIEFMKELIFWQKTRYQK